MSSRVTTLGNVAHKSLIDLGLRMPDGSTELFEVVHTADNYVAVMTKNIIDFMPFNYENNKHAGKANSYARSFVYMHLKELYQSVAKGNKLLTTNTFGTKTFRLPNITAMGLGNGTLHWQAFRNNATRVKFTGAFATSKEGAFGPGESDWYWLSTPYAQDDDYTHVIDSVGKLSRRPANYGSCGIAPAVDLKSSTPVVLIDGVWHFYEKFSQDSTSVSGEIKVGDWIEVVEVDETDERNGISVGDVYKVTCNELAGKKDAVIVNRNNESNDILYLNQIKKVDAPKLKDVPKAINSAVSKFEMLARSYTENLSETLVAKNADYGNSFEKSYEKHGLVSAVIRLEDKLNRLESLLENEAQVNESIDDTLLDIAGYAILTLIARGGNHDN